MYQPLCTSCYKRLYLYRMLKLHIFHLFHISGASPLVRAKTSKQELYLESLDEVVAFLQAQGATRVMDVQFLGKHTAFVALVQSTFDLAEVRG